MPPRERTSPSKAEVTTPDTDSNVDSDAVEAKPEQKPEQSETKSSDSSSGTEYLNVTNGPVVYDKDGHMVGGGDWVTVSGLDAVGKAARVNGYILPRSAL